MELREYASILRRRWWLPVLLVLAVGALSLLQLQPWRPAPPTYSASMRLLVGVMPLEGADLTAYDPRYYGWLTSEYLVDDFTEVVRSQLFASEVSARLAESGIELPPGVIQGSAATGKLHRIISLSYTWPDRDQLQAIADAAVAELSEDAADYFAQLGTEGAGVTLIDGPSYSEVGAGLRSRLELPLRLLLALAVGVGLAFLLEYLDSRVHGEREVKALGLPLVGRIPRR